MRICNIRVQFVNSSDIFVRDLAWTHTLSLFFFFILQFYLFTRIKLYVNFNLHEKKSTNQQIISQLKGRQMQKMVAHPKKFVN